MNSFKFKFLYNHEILFNYNLKELKDLIINTYREKSIQAPVTQWKSEGLMCPWSRDQNSPGVF